MISKTQTKQYQRSQLGLQKLSKLILCERILRNILSDTLMQINFSNILMLLQLNWIEYSTTNRTVASSNLASSTTLYTKKTATLQGNRCQVKKNGVQVPRVPEIFSSSMSVWCNWLTHLTFNQETWWVQIPLPIPNFKYGCGSTSKATVSKTVCS